MKNIYAYKNMVIMIQLYISHVCSSTFMEEYLIKWENETGIKNIPLWCSVLYDFFFFNQQHVQLLCLKNILKTKQISKYFRFSM